MKLTTNLSISTLLAMSAAPKFAIYPGLGEWAKENLHYSQTVRIGNIIKISGQGKIQVS
jgi:hypothetical protein